MNNDSHNTRPEMGAQGYVASLVDKNRLLFATCVAWIVLANLMYFSEVGGVRCITVTQRIVSVSDEPAWIDAWNAANFGYIDLYAGSSFSGGCFENAFSALGYIAFAVLPALVLTVVVATVSWVRRGARTT